VAKLGLLQTVSHKICRNPVYIRRVEGSHHTEANDRGRPWALPRARQAKKPKQVGKLSYARVVRKGLRVAVVCENYPESHMSKRKLHIYLAGDRPDC